MFFISLKVFKTKILFSVETVEYMFKRSSGHVFHKSLESLKNSHNAIIKVVDAYYILYFLSVIYVLYTYF